MLALSSGCWDQIFAGWRTGSYCTDTLSASWQVMLQACAHTLGLFVHLGEAGALIQISPQNSMKNREWVLEKFLDSWDKMACGLPKEVAQNPSGTATLPSRTMSDDMFWATGPLVR